MPELWFFILVTETCWSLLIQNERVGHFFAFLKGIAGSGVGLVNLKKVTHDSFCLLISKVIIVLLPVQPWRDIFFYFNRNPAEKFGWQF